MAQDNEVKKISDLVPDAGNYNRGTEKGRKLIGKSLKKLGAGRSILIDKDGNVIAGNKTLEGAAAAGIDEVIVVKTTGRQIVAVQRTDLEIGSKKGREMALADNATGAANLSWDLEMMAADGWTERDLEGWGVDLAGVETGKPEAVEDDYEVPDVEEIKTDIVAGDLFEIGEHRLLCGDSTKREDLERLMGGEKADVVFTDPPYNVGSETKGVASNSDNRQMKKLMAADWDKEFNVMNFLPNVDIFISENSTCYICTSHHLFGGIIEYLKAVFGFVSFCVWNKPNPMPSLMKRHWTWNTELVCYATRGRHTFNFPNEGHALSVWTLTKVAKCDLHPTMKPVSVPGTAICHSSKMGDIVLDFFIGSGTTMVAAHQLNRRCFGMEIDPKYCQVTLDRMRKLAPDLEVRKNGVKYNVDKA